MKKPLRQTSLLPDDTPPAPKAKSKNKGGRPPGRKFADLLPPCRMKGEDVHELRQAAEAEGETVSDFIRTAIKHRIVDLRRRGRI